MKRIIIAGAMLALSGALPAAATTTLGFSAVGDSHTADFNGFENNVVIPGLTAQLTYTLSSITGNSWIFDYTLSNTSVAPVTASRVSAFGFNIDPNFSSASVLTGSVFTKVSSGNVPGGLPNVEFCLTAKSNCAGGGGDGVFIGDSTSGSFKLDFASAPTMVSFMDNFVRYQSITAPGIVGGSAVGVITDPGTGAVPEPASWAMMLAGFGLVGGTMRKRNRALPAVIA